MLISSNPANAYGHHGGYYGPRIFIPIVPIIPYVPVVPVYPAYPPQQCQDVVIPRTYFDPYYGSYTAYEHHTECLDAYGNWVWIN